MLPLFLCWHNVQHLIIGTLIYQMILKYKGEKCWVILDTCNTPVCWAASGLLNSSLEGKVQSSASGFPPTPCHLACKVAQRGGDFSSFFKRKRVEREIRDIYQL